MDGLYFDEANGDQWVPGVEGYLVVRRANAATLEIWSEDADVFYGRVPEAFTSEQIAVVMCFFCEGEKRGEAQGRADKQREIQRVLGLA